MCPACESTVGPVSENQSLLKKFPILCKEWDFVKNNCHPKNFRPYSGKSVWWICKERHSYKSIISNRTGLINRGCCYCSNQKVLRGFNDLLTTCPKLCEEWHYNKNFEQPYNLIGGSKKLFWWKCKFGHEWRATIYHRKNGTNCQRCINRTSHSQEELCNWCIDVSTNFIVSKSSRIEKYEPDILIEEKKLIIEYNGDYWHCNPKK